MREKRLSFGPFILDTEQGSLVRDGKPLPVGQHGVSLLASLLEADGETVSRETLIARAWPDTIVEDGNLTTQIATLRKLLGQRQDGSEWIKTVPRRGYRLPINEAGDHGVHPPIIRPSLAVLPFTNLSGDSDQDYFVDGVVEDLITALSRFKSFGIVARNSSFIYKGRSVDVRDVAKDLGVRYVLEGSYRRAGDRQRVTTQLVDAESGEHVWARNFDGIANDIFDVQDRIVEDVASLVDGHLLMAEIQRAKSKRPDSLDAYDLYLRGLADLRTHQPELRAGAFQMLMRALEIDPTYAPALANATSAVAICIDSFTPLTADDHALCLELAERGLAAAQGDATVLALCGLGLATAAHQYDRAVRIIRDAFAANPNNVLVIAYAAIAELHWGSVQDAVDLNLRALRVAEGTAYAYVPLRSLAHAYLALGQYEEALSAAERSYAGSPHSAITHWMLIAATAHLGRLDEARRWLEGLQRLSPGITIAGLRKIQSGKTPGPMSPIFEGLRLAGMPET
jgi:TolB-like protein